jgi:hypothetical protein
MLNPLNACFTFFMDILPWLWYFFFPVSLRLQMSLLRNSNRILILFFVGITHQPNSPWRGFGEYLRMGY